MMIRRQSGTQSVRFVEKVLSTLKYYSSNSQRGGTRKKKKKKKKNKEKDMIVQERSTRTPSYMPIHQWQAREDRGQLDGCRLVNVLKVLSSLKVSIKGDGHSHLRLSLVSQLVSQSGQVKQKSKGNEPPFC